MDQTTQNSSRLGDAKPRQMDFASHKPNKTEKSPKPTASKAPSDPPTPVTSAKAAINAMYAEHARKTTPILVPSAREAVNAAAGASHNSKSAASLHHGSIQKNIDTSRTSAAALLQRAKSPRPAPAETQPTDSFDPLASRLQATPAAQPSTASEQEIPVIRTSLKLGSSARPKPAPVVLPPNARMARVARPVGATNRSPKVGLLHRRASDVQVIQPNSINPGQHPQRLASKPATSLPATSENEGTLKVNFLSSKPAPKALAAPAQSVKSAPVAPPPARNPRLVRDPQMLGSSSNRPAKAKASAAPLWPAAASTALGPKPVLPGSAKFRPAPKGYASTTPSGVSADNSYVMATPPKINLARPHTTEADLGVVEDYHAGRIPEPLDTTPASSSRASAFSSPEIKADNTSNYSFSTKNAPKKKSADNNRYALGGQSPFLKSVNVEKRPLSDNSAPVPLTKIERPVVDAKSGKISRKNVYTKKKSKSDARQELPQRPTVIVPASRRSKVPLFLLILVTIILGAVVGAAAYLCFFQ